MKKITTIFVALWVILFSVQSAAEIAHAQDPTPPTPTSPSELPAVEIISGVVPDLPSGYMIVEGDIQIRRSDFRRRYLMTSPADSSDNIQSPQAPFDVNRLWPNGIVPYQFSANVGDTSRTAMRQAMDAWQNSTNASFTLCANNVCTGDFLSIQASNVNNSAVGRQGGRQIVNIFNWNNRAIMAHELGHVLGLYHEQSRTDRDSFIRVNFGNVCKATDLNCVGGFCLDDGDRRIDCDFNFIIESSSWRYGAYDFDSVMHYERDAFSRNGQDTITVLSPNDVEWQNQIGQRTHLSYFDSLIVSFLYPLSDWRFLKTGLALCLGACQYPVGTFFQPYDRGDVRRAVAGTPANGKLWLDDGYYSAAGVWDKPITLSAAYGTVILSR